MELITGFPIALRIGIAIIVVAIVRWGVRLVKWVWVEPKRLEKCLRQQGLAGNPYRLLHGDMKEYIQMAKEEQTKSIQLNSGDICPHVLPYYHHIINNFGKNSFMWFGPAPRLNIMDPELAKEILSKPNEYQKVLDPITEMIIGGLLVLEGDKWAKHRKIVNPAFHMEKLKKMLPAMYMSCIEMTNKWQKLVSVSGSSEVDVWPYLQDLSGDVISRTAFGSNHEEGRQIFELQKKQVDLAFQLYKFIYFPGWRYLPIKEIKRLKEICNELEVVLSCIIKKREKATNMGEVNEDDLLGILMESNSKEIQEHGVGMSIEEVIKECKLFYFAGSETTSNLIVWTLVMLSKYPHWQTRAREEVLQVFETNNPDFDGLTRLKIVTMILHEVLRLYPPATMVIRGISKETKLGNMTLPAGVEFTIPMIFYHYDHEIWGDDAKEFKPERFSEGVSNATKGRASLFPFGWGPRICIGQNFAMIEAKMAIAMILQRFSFELSPSYKHAPFSIITLQPQSEVPLILHKI